MLPYVTYPRSQFELMQGKPTDFQSSAPVTRSFCSRCGTPMTYRHKDYPDRLDVMTCTLDDPDQFPPSMHIWTSQKPGWSKINDGLPTYAKTKEADQ
jgi:hypothetical protein